MTTLAAKSVYSSRKRIPCEEMSWATARSSRYVGKTADSQVGCIPAVKSAYSGITRQGFKRCYAGIVGNTFVVVAKPRGIHKGRCKAMRLLDRPDLPYAQTFTPPIIQSTHAISS